MIIIDSIYINSYGGKSLLIYFIDSLRKKNSLNKYLFFFDERLILDFNISEINYVKVRSNHFSRKKAYQKRIKEIKKVFCFSNVPPPIKLNCSVYIYFHNLLLLKWDTPIQLIKFLYIFYFNRATYNWITQTEYTKNFLIKRINLIDKRALVLPFYKVDDIKFRVKNFNSNKLIFIYPTSNNYHKNLESILKAFLEVRTKSSIELYITVEGNNIKTMNKTVIFTGLLSRNELFSIYNKSHYLVLPSKKESLGLPIIEAIKSGCKILVSSIPTFHEICEPSYFFNPENNSEIKNAIEFACNEKNIEMPSLKIKNQINDLINLLT